MEGDRPLATVSVRELARHASAIVRKVTDTGRPAIVTNRGQPVAVVLPLDPEELEDYVLATAPRFVRSMREADRDLAAGHTAEADDFFASLGGSDTEHRDGEESSGTDALRRTAAKRTVSRRRRRR
jgi:prevent-host-death family protein